ncbi:MAG: MBL fold metallo-hydrolase [Moraxellaceae bacterium]|nr:MBL fold metallo-hydrolase [Pseudobdellovibrionaceae bacterium]
MKHFVSNFFKLTLFIFTCATACASSPYPQSDHYDGEKFFQPGAAPARGFLDLLKWQLSGDKKEWPTFRENTAKPNLVNEVDSNALNVTFINHATFLIQATGLNILTDPIFSQRASPVQWAGPKRARSPGLNLENLPRIDLVVISHNHYDHMDKISIEELQKKFAPLFIVPLGDAKVLKKFGVTNVIELDWWQTHAVPNTDLAVTFTRVQHWSSRTPFDRNESLWGGYVFKNKKFSVYFGGDTGYGSHFKETSEKLGPFDLSLIPIGAYEPRWFMKEQHMNPEEAVQAHLDLKSKLSLGCHFGTFQLADEGIDDPVNDLEKAKKKLNVKAEDFVSPDNGQSFMIKL